MKGSRVFRLAQPMDFILIHGYDLTEDGQMDPLLLLRLDYGLEFFQNNWGKNIVVGGKHGMRDKEIYEATQIPESYYMKQYLVERGIDQEIIYEESEGGSTYNCTENVYNNLIIPNQWRSGVIVSNFEHLERIILITSKIFPEEMIIAFSGPRIPNEERRKQFIELEKKSIDRELKRR